MLYITSQTEQVGILPSPNDSVNLLDPGLLLGMKGKVGQEHAYIELSSLCNFRRPLFVLRSFDSLVPGLSPSSMKVWRQWRTNSRLVQYKIGWTCKVRVPFYQPE